MPGLDVLSLASCAGIVALEPEPNVFANPFSAAEIPGIWLAIKNKRKTTKKMTVFLKFNFSTP